MWVARGTVFQEIQPRAGFKTSGFVEKNLGRGYRRTNPTDVGSNSQAFDVFLAEGLEARRDVLRIIVGEGAGRQVS